MASLTNVEIERYSRQLVLDDFGVDGQRILKNSAVLIVGAGGLGCPAGAYLAAAGIGSLGVVDYDHVEIDNLHRQILHGEDRLGLNKAVSLISSLKKLNSSITYHVHENLLNRENAMDIIGKYDLVLDCSDNVPTRYLLNDACVLLKKPLISGSALRMEGQLTVYNYDDGPCYRCVFPNPPAPGTVTNCSDGGVLGVVPGIIGSMQALEAIKVLTRRGEPCRQRLILFDALTARFRDVKLRGRRSTCAVCGDEPSIKNLVDYELLCGARADDKHTELNELDDGSRVQPREYQSLRDTGKPHVLIDVRPSPELHICALPNSINVPFSSVIDREGIPEELRRIPDICEEAGASLVAPLPVFVVCRRGNDSQLVVNKLKCLLKDLPVIIKDLRGGLRAWAEAVDPDFPTY